MFGRRFFVLLSPALVAGLSIVGNTPAARADYYGSYGSYYPRYSQQAAPVISLELDPQKSLNSAFRVAAREGRDEDLEHFLKLGADINAQSDDGMTALMYASRGCYVGEVRFILRHHGQVGMRDSHKRTALMFAVTDSCEEVVRVLLKSPGLSLEARDNDGETIFDMAREAASEDVGGSPTEIRRLLEQATAGSHSVEDGRKWVQK